MERVKYNQMLKQTKTSTLSEKVKECGRDTKKLYKLVNELAGANKENPLPRDVSHKDLADQFPEYCLSKI